MQDQINVRGVWARVVDEVKQNVIHPTLWKALEASVPVVIEDGQFVVGFPPGTFHLSGHLSSLDHKNVIEATILKYAGERLLLRIIEGGTMDDWQAVKVKEAHATALRDAAARKQKDETTSTKAWEVLLEQVGRKYAVMPLRQLPQAKATFIVESVKMISDALDRIYADGTEPDELQQRAIGRVLEKIATMVEVPAPVAALELLRMRRK